MSERKLFLIPFLLLLAGCVAEERILVIPMDEEEYVLYAGEDALPFEHFPPRYSVDPPHSRDVFKVRDEAAPEVYDPFRRYAGQTYYGKDGSVTRHYYLAPGTADNVATLLVAQVEDLVRVADTDGTGIDNQTMDTVIVWQNFVNDPRNAKGVTGGFNNYNHETGFAADLMVVRTKKPDKLMEVDSFLTNLQAEVPMIEIEVRVAELSMSDNLQYGLSGAINKVTTGAYFLKGWLTNFNTESMKVSGLADFPGALVSLGGIHDKYGWAGQLELLQRISDSDILSAPKITILNGHRAVIKTGDQTPISKVVTSGSTTFYSYEYKPTGITLVIVPHLLPGGIIQVQVTAEVSSITGQQTVDLGGGPVQLPIVSKRNIGTKLRVKSGKKFIIGGLYTYSDIQIVSKVPLLGDIPVIGYLFKSESTERAKSEILFKITPRIVRRPSGLIDRGEE